MICRSLGYQGAWSASANAQYGLGNGLIWLDEVHCNGTEQFVQNCSHSPIGHHNCKHSEDAGVSCIGEWGVCPHTHTKNTHLLLLLHSPQALKGCRARSRPKPLGPCYKASPFGGGLARPTLDGIGQ